MRIIFSFFFLLCSTWVFTQDTLPSIRWSDQQQMLRRGSRLDLVGIEGDKAFTLAYDANDMSTIYVDLYDVSSMQKLASLPLSLPSSEVGESQFLKLFALHDRLIMFSSSVSRESRDLNISATAFALDGSIIKEPKIVQIVGNSIRGKAANPTFVLSADSSAILIAYALPKEKSGAKGYALKVLSPDLKTIWSNELRLPYSEDYFVINHYLLDAQNKVWMMSGEDVYKTRSRQLVKNERQHYLLVYDHKNNSLKQIDINLRENWIHSIALSHMYDGNVAVAGFYSSDFYFTVKGTFAMIIDGDTKQVRHQSFADLDPSFFKQFPERAKLDKDLELENYYYDALVAHDDGHLSILAEEYFVTEYFSTEPATGRQTVSYSYHYGDIIVINLNPNTELNWQARIPKLQISSNDRGENSGYSFCKHRDGLQFYFLDNPANTALTVGQPKNLVSWRKAETANVFIDKGGKMSKGFINADTGDRTVIRPSIFVPSKAQVLTLSQSGRDYRVGVAGYR